MDRFFMKDMDDMMYDHYNKDNDIDEEEHCPDHRAMCEACVNALDPTLDDYFNSRHRRASLDHDPKDCHEVDCIDCQEWYEAMGEAIDLD